MDSYNAEIYSDGPNADKQPKNSVVKFRRVNKNTILKLKLAEGGGWAARIEKVK